MTKLELAVKEIVESQEDQTSYVNDVLTHGCVSGIVTELIYYTDTHKFYDTHYEDIEALREEYEEDFGHGLRIEGDLKNFMAWWSFEYTVWKMYN